MPEITGLSLWKILTVYFAAMSVLTFILYGIDKRRAIKGTWRISEKTLLGLGVIGGALGGLIGMKVFRHKTKHRYFWVINAAALGVQAGVVILVIRG